MCQFHLLGGLQVCGAGCKCRWLCGGPGAAAGPQYLGSTDRQAPVLHPAPATAEGAEGETLLQMPGYAVLTYPVSAQPDNMCHCLNVQPSGNIPDWK